MRLKHRLLGIVGLLAIGGTSACGAVSSAKASNSVQSVGVSVEVSPNRTSPGLQVAVRANCSDKSPSATVTSPAFGTITLARSNASSALLMAQVVIPNTVQPGTFDVTVTCHGGATATTKLTVVVNASAQPTVGPHTGGGFLNGRDDGSTTSAPWLAASAATLLLAGSLSAVSIRRRRRASAARAAHGGDGYIDLGTVDTGSIDWGRLDRDKPRSDNVLSRLDR
jgi:hypothetical protein